MTIAGGGIGVFIAALSMVMAASKSIGGALPAALVCTMGGKPQIVTLVLDELMRRGSYDGIAITHVCVIHLSQEDERINKAVARVRRELRTYYPTPPTFIQEPVRPLRAVPSGARFEPVTGPAVANKSSPEFGEAAYYTAYRLLARLKNDGLRIELCCTGGPHALGIIVHSAASLVCGTQDRLWDLDCPADFIQQAGDGQLLHRPVNDDRIRLNALRFVGLGQLFANLNTAARMTPAEIVSASAATVQQYDRPRCERVLRALSPAQRRILRAFAQATHSVDEVARRLNLSKNTVNSHKLKIYEICRPEFGLKLDAPLHFSFLREHFGNLPDDFWQEVTIA